MSYFGAHSQPLHRRLQTHGLLALAACTACSSSALARPNLLTIDVRVHGTGGKEVFVSNPGDTFTLDVLATVTGSDADPTNDGMNGFIGSFLTSNGGLLGNLTPLNVQAPFNALGSGPGVAKDLDGDGDLDIGSNSTTQATGMFAVRAGTYLPVTQTLVGQFTFTALSLSAPSTQIAFRGYNNPGGAFVKFDGALVNFRCVEGPNVAFGAPVVVRTEQVVGNGETTYLSGNVNAHVTVDGAVLPAGGSTVVLTNGLTVHAGGLFDMRDLSDGVTENHEVRIDDVASGNEGGSLFVRKVTVGYSTNGTFTQSAGVSSINSELVVGNTTASNGTIRASGGALFVHTLTLGSAGNAAIEQVGGQTSVAVLNAKPTADKSSTITVSGGELNLTTANLSNVNGGVVRYLQNGGTARANDEVTFTGTSSTADVGGVLNDGTLNFNRLTVAGHAAFTQNAGTLAVGALRFISGAATTGDGFVLNGGTANIVNVGGDGRSGATVPAFIQNGGNLNTSSSIGLDHVTDGVVFNAGVARVHSLALEFSTIRQNGGTVHTDYVDLSTRLTQAQNIRSGYKLFGGTLTIHSQLKGAGTIDFNNAASQFVSADGSFVDFTKVSFLNAANASVFGEHGSLMEFAAGADPLETFGSFASNGIVHVAGEPLNIPPTARVGGSGEITGNTTNNGTISPGNSPGEIDIDGNYAQGTAAHLEIQIGGTTADQFDLLAITGAATLNGTLDVSLLDDFVPSFSNSFTFLTASSSITGRFANTLGDQVFFNGGRFDVAYGANSITLSHFVAVPEPTTIGVIALAGFGALSSRRRRRALCGE